MNGLRMSYQHFTKDAAVIDASLLVDSSIIIGRPPKKVGKDNSAKKECLHEDNGDTVVIAALTYRTGSGAERGSALVCWFLVAGVEYLRPRVIKEWHCLGFGRFILITLIKRCTLSLLELPRAEESCAVPVPAGVNIYLQCTEEAPFKFYISCGLVHLNDDEKLGFEFLPNTIAITLLSDENDSKVWSAHEIPPWIEPESEDVKMAPLLRLDSGCLRQSSAAMLGSLEVGDSVWCCYPHSTLVGSSSDEVPTADLEQAFDGLDLLGSLLPPRKKPAAAASHASTSCETLCGEISLKGRLDHGKAGGEGWMSLGELQMMMALVMRDGRFDGHVQIIPLQTMQHIEKTATAFITAVMAGQRLELKK